MTPWIPKLLLSGSIYITAARTTSGIYLVTSQVIDGLPLALVFWYNLECALYQASNGFLVFTSISPDLLPLRRKSPLRLYICMSNLCEEDWVPGVASPRHADRCRFHAESYREIYISANIVESCIHRHRHALTGFIIDIHFVLIIALLFTRLSSLSWCHWAKDITRTWSCLPTVCQFETPNGIEVVSRIQQTYP